MIQLDFQIFTNPVIKLISLLLEEADWKSIIDNLFSLPLFIVGLFLIIIKLYIGPFLNGFYTFFSWKLFQVQHPSEMFKVSYIGVHHHKFKRDYFCIINYVTNGKRVYTFFLYLLPLIRKWAIIVQKVDFIVSYFILYSVSYGWCFDWHRFLGFNKLNNYYKTLWNLFCHFLKVLSLLFLLFLAKHYRCLLTLLSFE